MRATVFCDELKGRIMGEHTGVTRRRGEFKLSQTVVVVLRIRRDPTNTVVEGEIEARVKKKTASNHTASFGEQARSVEDNITIILLQMARKPGVILLP
ncbi:unnamed protein product [Boreogadus saida]